VQLFFSSLTFFLETSALKVAARFGRETGCNGDTLGVRLWTGSSGNSKMLSGGSGFSSFGIDNVFDFLPLPRLARPLPVVEALLLRLEEVVGDCICILGTSSSLSLLRGK